MTDPIPAKSARKASPGCDVDHLVHSARQHDIAVRRPAPNVASLFASQATHRAGLPSAAAPAPVSMTSPFRLTDDSDQRQVQFEQYGTNELAIT